MEIQKLGIKEYEEVFYDNLSTLITNSSHIESCKDFYDEIVYKSFEVYQKNTSNYSVNEILNFFHIFLYAMFNEKPSVEKPEDKITLKY